MALDPIRLGGLGTSAASGGVLLTAALLTPETEGHGTHRQLGLPPCLWEQTLNRPCGTCGMTTAFSHAADGDLVVAAATQPLGAVLAVATAAVFWGGVHAAVTGARVYRVAEPLMRGRGLVIVAGAFFAAWAYTLLTWDG